MERVYSYNPGARTGVKGKKGKASSLDIAPLTVLNSGTFTTSEVAADWQ